MNKQLHFKFVALLFFNFLGCCHSFAQNGTISIDIPLLPALKDSAGKIEVSLDLTRKIKDSTVYENRIRFDGRTGHITISNLQEGNYNVYISEEVPVVISQKFAPRLITIGGLFFEGIAIYQNLTTYIDENVVKNHVHLMDVFDKRCPKCHSSEYVITICKGLRVDFDDDAPFPDCHQSKEYFGCESEIGEPLWYCNKDNIEF